MSRPLTAWSFARGVDHLCAIDDDLAGVVARHGPPPMGQRSPGFATLVHMILEQQVSLASARAAFDRIVGAVAGDLTPRGLLGFDDVQMLEFGFSRPKTRYVRLLATATAEGRMDFDRLAGLPDAEVRAVLTAHTGIGPWTADVYLLMAMLRPDAWPVGDLALAVAAAEVKRLPSRPDQIELVALGEPWRPWRAVAARILWHHYLSTPRPRVRSRA